MKAPQPLNASKMYEYSSGYVSADSVLVIFNLKQ